MKPFISGNKERQRGQSFVELSLVILILALLLAGVVELGYLINSYLHVFDAAREAARFSNSSVPFGIDPNTGEFMIDGSTSSYVTNQAFYVRTAIEALRVMPPIILSGNRGDDIVVSAFSVAGSSIRRWPDGYVNGWSLCNNRSDPALQGDLNLADWSSCTSHNSRFTAGQILALMDASAPASGVLLVEIFYNYPQILKLPVFAQVIPDPIPVYVYSVMPLSSAEPTATPIL